MDFTEIVKRVNTDHKIISEILHESITVLVSYTSRTYEDMRDDFLDQVDIFLKNYDRVVAPHYRFEEKHLYSLLYTEFREETEILIEEHKILKRHRDKIKRLKDARDINEVLNSLKTLYEIAARHQEKEINLTKKYAKTKNIPME